MTKSREQEAFDAAQKWLESIQPLSEPLGSQVDEMKKLVGNPGFAVLLGLLMGARQAAYVQLAHLPLATSGDAARASVLQGKTQGIDLVRETVLEFFTVKGAE